MEINIQIMSKDYIFKYIVLRTHYMFVDSPVEVRDLGPLRLIHV